MKCARREAGARRPAPCTSADSPRRPEPRPGRSRARLFGFLPALALLLGALSLFHAAPAAAQTAPLVPQNVQVTPGDARLTVSWQAPSSWGSWTASGYEMEENTDPSFLSVRDGANDASIGPSDTSFVVTGLQQGGLRPLTNGDVVTIRIRAYSVDPASDGSQASHYLTSPWVTVTATVGAPAAPPTGLTVTPGNAQLSLSWTAPTGTLTGYDVHYTSAAESTVGNDVAASGSNPATAWVAVTRSGTTASQTISSLTNDTLYRVRVRAKNSNGGGESAHAF